MVNSTRRPMTLSEVKLELSDRLLDSMGFDAETYIDKINSLKKIEDIQLIVNDLTVKLKSDSSKKLVSAWLDLMYSYKM